MYSCVSNNKLNNYYKDNQRKDEIYFIKYPIIRSQRLCHEDYPHSVIRNCDNAHAVDILATKI